MTTQHTLEEWKADWSCAFTPEAREAAVVLQHIIPNRTFVRVEMLSKAMMKIWFDLMSHNHPRLINKAQLGTTIAGPCELYMCYLTSSHMEISDPVSMSCIVPMYTNQPYVCLQGLMRLDTTFIGPPSPDANEQLTLILMAAKMAPRTQRVPPFRFVFISPLPYLGHALRYILERKKIQFNRCAAGSLVSMAGVHERKKCQCLLNIGDANAVDIITHREQYKCILPQMTYGDEVIGGINVPWATGRSFDIIRKIFVVEDEGIAALTEAWITRSEFLQKNANDASFLSILMGIDGIHAIDFAKFITIDPSEVKTLMIPPPDQASASGP